MTLSLTKVKLYLETLSASSGRGCITRNKAPNTLPAAPPTHPGSDEEHHSKNSNSTPYKVTEITESQQKESSWSESRFLLS